jgi:hypothetical protein
MIDRGAGNPSWGDGYRVPPESLAIFRQLFGLGLLVFLLPRFQWIAQFPDAFFDPPPGVTAFFSGFAPHIYFLAIDVLLIWATIFLIAGSRVTLASWVITCGLLAGNAWAYSFGKIDHDILLVVLPVFLAAAGWDGKRPTRVLALASLALVISLAMATSAWQKLWSGWLDASHSAVLGHSVAFAVMAGTPLAFPFAVRYLPGAAWELMDWATVAFEFAFILVVFRPPLFRAVCGFACFFHVVVAMLMPITFLHNIPSYAAFVNWDELLRRSGLAAPVHRTSRWLSDRSLWQLIAASAFVSVAYLRWGNLPRLATAMLGPQYASLPRQLALWIAAAGAVILIVVRLAHRTSREGHSRPARGDE